MAQVTRHAPAEQAIDHYLAYELQQWNSVPERVKSWPELDALEKEDFQLEWEGITESRLLDLHRWAQQGLLTPSQRRRYDELLRLVDAQRPFLERMLRE